MQTWKSQLDENRLRLNEVRTGVYNVTKFKYFSSFIASDDDNLPDTQRGVLSDHKIRRLFKSKMYIIVVHSMALYGSKNLELKIQNGDF